MEHRLTLVIPIYNECGNIIPLIKAIDERHAISGFPHELILVNNGSEDNSALEIELARKEAPWIRVISLNENHGYGGGVDTGLRAASSTSTHLGWIPADLQYSIEHTETIWQKTLAAPDALHKGVRTSRYDGISNRVVSSIYSRLARYLLALGVRDMNGLPKIFPKRVLAEVPFTPAANFLFDCQIMMATKLLGLPIYEHSVTFFARRAGVSSWSSKRVKTYVETFHGLMDLRANTALMVPRGSK